MSRPIKFIKRSFSLAISDIPFFFCYVIYFFGIIAGAISVGFSDDLSFAQGLFGKFCNQSSSFLPLFASRIFSFLPLIAVSYLLGMCLFGIPLCYILCSVRGLGFGYIAGYVYTTLGLKGFWFCFFILLIPEFIFSFCTIISCRASIRLSASTISVSMPYSKGVKLWDEVKRHGKIHGLMAFCGICCSAISALLFIVFIKIFAF